MLLRESGFIPLKDHNDWACSFRKGFKAPERTSSILDLGQARRWSSDFFVNEEEEKKKKRS